MPLITGFQLALGIGASGAMVDVTSYIKGPEGISNSWGQKDQFRAPETGVFSFTLENQDGRFTPGNPASPLLTPLAEGTPVAWSLGGRIVAGKIKSMSMSSTETEWGRLQITCDDMLGDLSRYKMPAAGFLPALAAAATPLLLWPLNDSSSATWAVESTGNGSVLAANQSMYYNRSTGLFYMPTQTVAFGSPAPGFIGHTCMTISNLAESNFATAGVPGAMVTNDSIGSMVAALKTSFVYPADSGGFWGWWCDSVLGDGAVEVAITGANYPNGQDLGMMWGGISVDITAKSCILNAGDLNKAALTIPITPGPHFYAIGITGTLSAGVWTTFVQLYIDGVAQGTPQQFNTAAGVAKSWNPQLYQVMVNVYGQASAGISELGHYLTQPNAQIANTTTEAGKLAFYDAVIPTLASVSISAALSDQPIGQTIQTGTAMDALVALVTQTEQGYMYPSTSGTVLTPVTTLVICERTREVTPKVSFDARLELDGTIPFERNIANTVATETVTGDGAIATVTDSTITGRAVYGTGSDTILNSQIADLQLWASDRINRGKVTTPWPSKIVIDAATTPTDRSADLLGLAPGDCIQFTNIDATVCGFSTWTGWLLGVEESHTPQQNRFTLYLAPVVAQGIFDTSVADFDQPATLAAAIGPTDTTLTISTTGLTLSDLTVLPVNIQIGAEQLTVTATAVSGTNQLLTVTRGAAGTTAAAHSAGLTVALAAAAAAAF